MLEIRKHVKMNACSHVGWSIWWELFSQPKWWKDRRQSSHHSFIMWSQYCTKMIICQGVHTTPAHVHILHTCPPHTYILKHLNVQPSSQKKKSLAAPSSEGHCRLEVSQKVWDTVPRAQSILRVCHWICLPACSSEKHRDPRTNSPPEHQPPKSHSHHLVSQIAKWETTERHMVILDCMFIFYPSQTGVPLLQLWLHF